MDTNFKFKLFTSILFDVREALPLKIHVFWDVTLCHWVNGS